MINRNVAVIDCGSAEWGDQESIEVLRDTYHPDVIIALDPSPACNPWWEEEREGTKISFRRAAAWTHDKGAFLHGGGTTGHVTESEFPEKLGEHPTKIATVDLAKEFHLAALQHDNVVIKLDVEGGEVALLTHLREQGILDDQRLWEVLVEWHGEPHTLFSRLPKVFDW